MSFERSRSTQGSFKKRAIPARHDPNPPTGNLMAKQPKSNSRTESDSFGPIDVPADEVTEQETKR